MSKYQALLGEIDTKAKEVKGIFDLADDKQSGDVTDEQKARVIALNTEIAEIEKRAVDAKQMEELRGGNATRLAQLNQPASHPEFPGKQPEGAPAGTHQELVKSMGDLFNESPELKAWLGQFPGGIISENHKGFRSPPVQLKAAFKDLITGVTSTSGGAFVVNQQSGIYDPLGRRPLMLRDIISTRTTDSDTIEFVRQTSRTNNAAAVAEATASSGSSGVKPESLMAFERVTTVVKTIANVAYTTRRALADAGQMRGIIDQELRDNLAEEVDDQILNGDGVGENFVGLDAVSGTQDQAWDTNILTTTRKARTLVRTVGRATPTAYVLNPSDWQTIDLLQDNEARYFFGGPSQLGTPRLWGLPVVESEAQAVGFGWVGEWAKAVLWDRQQAAIFVSDSHSDFFIRNLLAILAELRAAFAVIRPAAFVEMDLTA